MKPYPSYKDSGVEWIGEIPVHWKARKLKYEAYVEMGQSPSSEDYNLENNGLPFLQGNADFTELYPTPRIWCDTANKMAKNGDVLLSVRAPIGAVNIANQKYGIGRGLCAIHSVRACQKYLYYTALSLHDELNSIGTGSTYTAISVDDLMNVFVPQPPTTEQKQIVSFLDTKTQKIDELIEKTEQKIELLKEKRTSLINHCVTKGLNPNVEMKDSGVEWIREIPSHWVVKPLKYICGYNLESLGSDTKPDYELDYLEISDVNSIGEISNPTHYEFSKSPSRCRRIVKQNDIIISTVRTYLKSIGFIENEVSDLICSTGFCVVTPSNQIIPKLLFYLVRSEWFVSEVISKSEGVSYPSIQSEKLVGIKVVLLPKPEQTQIVEYLDEQTQKIDATIEKETQRIELLKEYRQSLISEVVTGKIDVREWNG